MPADTATDIVWRPSAEAVAATALAKFMRTHGIADYDDLNRRSADDPEWYWRAVADFFAVPFAKSPEKMLDVSKGAAWAEWCVGGRLNIAAACIDRHRDTPTMQKEAVVWEAEDGTQRRWTYADLAAETNRLADGLRALGVKPGQAVGIFMPMLPETVAAFFAIARIGAIAVPLFSGFAPDAVVARLADAGAVAVLASASTKRRGQTVPMKATLDEAAKRIPTLRYVVVLGADAATPWTAGRDRRWEDVVADGNPDSPPADTSLVDTGADDRFMIIFTSGTTGQAKGTVHSHAGFLLKLASDFGLVMDFRPEDRFFWMSDLGWLVGPMEIVVSIFFGGTLVLAEGAPDWPDNGRLWRLVETHKVSYLGVAPTMARAMMRYGDDLVARYDLSSIRAVASSGELWNPDSWLWFFEHVCKRKAPILNVSGGTEIGWGIVAQTAIHPMKPCAFSGSMPGMGADIVDAEGRPVDPGVMGELALRVPSIGLTRGLWNAPDRYMEAYWTKIPGLWVHGDWASRDEDGFWYLHGRSDDTIKVAGKRCGPAEIEALLMATGLVAEAAATGIADPLKGETVLCVCVPSDKKADPGLPDALKAAVVAGLSPAFRPKDVLLVADLPKTRSLKVMRRVVRALYEGRDPGDLASLVNPPALDDLKRAIAERKAAS